MNIHSTEQIRSPRRPLNNRRNAVRDRRILEGTMKYRGEYVLVDVISLSESGAFVQTPDLLPQLDDSLTINIELPHLGSTVMISGRVNRVGLSSRWLQREGGFGIKFTRFYTQVGRESLQKHLAA